MDDFVLPYGKQHLPTTAFAFDLYLQKMLRDAHHLKEISKYPL